MLWWCKWLRTTVGQLIETVFCKTRKWILMVAYRCLQSPLIPLFYVHFDTGTGFQWQNLTFFVHPSISGLSAPALLFQSWTVCLFVRFFKKAFPEITELLDCFENAPVSFDTQLWDWALTFGYWIPELLTWRKIIGLRFFLGNNWHEPLPVSE